MRAPAPAVVTTLALLLLPAVDASAAPPGCGGRRASTLPAWAAERRMTVLVDSVLLGGTGALRTAMPCWRISVRGRPALMIGAAERDVAAQRPRIAPLVVIGLGYNSLWERGRRRYGHWASRFDGEALRLLAALRRRGARQVVWVTLREPTRRVVPPAGWAELRTYAWYFPYVNERLRRLDRRHDDVVLADWAAASGRPGLTYDSIHLNARGAARMARTIEAAIVRGARRPAPGAEAVRTPTSPSAS